jgi:alkanesulfonate monooxygenase SsuD/methylene tetrahydromethanopterin reductase-like flavin-dependent oxidoreductase (luciferase family)
MSREYARARTLEPSFGVLHDFRQPLPHRQGYGAYYAECLCEVEEAERLGFSCVWLSEHHAAADGFLPSPLVVASAIAVRTERIEIGTNILVLPLHHPLRVAEDAAVVDLLSGGRFVLGVGQSPTPQEFAALGVERRSRAARLEEGVEIIRRAWQKGETGFNGREWQLPDGPFGPRPERRIPILIGAVSDKAVERAVRIADGLIVYCGKPADLPARSDLLARALERANRSREGFRFVATGIVHVGDDAESAWEQAAPGIAYLEGQLAQQAGRGDLATGSWRPRRQDYLVGTAEEVAARLSELHQAVGFDHFAAWARLPGLSHKSALTSMRLLAERVIPNVHGSSASGAG